MDFSNLSDEVQVDTIEGDLRRLDLDEAMAGVSTIVHLAEDRGGGADAKPVLALLDLVQAAAARTGIEHFVLLSSALVYGGHPDNPVPMTEHQPTRPSSLPLARLKLELERASRQWASQHDRRLAIVRPAVALSEDDVSWIGSALRAAMMVRVEQVDPPVQFVHHDDLASAVALIAAKKLDSVFNVAAEGWIGADEFRSLRGETEVRLPERIGQLRLRSAKMLADRATLEGLEPYVNNPWVVATDKIRAEGWQPSYSNDEVYVLGTVAPLLSSLGPQKRQELALGAAGAVGAAALGLVAWLSRRATT